MSNCENISNGISSNLFFRVARFTDPVLKNPGLAPHHRSACPFRFNRGLTPSYRIASRYGHLILLNAKALGSVRRPVPSSLHLPPRASTPPRFDNSLYLLSSRPRRPTLPGELAGAQSWSVPYLTCHPAATFHTTLKTSCWRLPLTSQPLLARIYQEKQNGISFQSASERDLL